MQWDAYCSTYYGYPSYPPPPPPPLGAHPSQTMTGTTVRFEEAGRGSVSGGPAGYSGAFTSAGKEPSEVNF